MTTIQEKVSRHNGRVDKLDALQKELLANPETVHVMIAGQSVPFLLSVDGFERAAAAGHDPMPAIGRLVGSLFAGDTTLAEVDATDPDAIGDALKSKVTGAALRNVLTTGLLSDLVPLLYAGVVSFDRGLTYEAFKARVTLPTVFSVVVKALPQMVALVSGVESPEPEGDGDEGN